MAPCWPPDGASAVSLVGRGGFIAEAKQREDSELWMVTVQNRNDLVERILDWVAAA